MLRNGLKDILQEHVLHRKLRQLSSALWIGYQTKKLIRRRNRIHKVWKKSASKELLKEYESLKCQIQKCLGLLAVLEVCWGAEL